jgi:hypothetical protein
MNNDKPKITHNTAKMGLDTCIPAFFRPLSTISDKIIPCLMRYKREIKEYW